MIAHIQSAIKKNVTRLVLDSATSSWEYHWNNANNWRGRQNWYAFYSFQILTGILRESLFRSIIAHVLSTSMYRWPASNLHQSTVRQSVLHINKSRPKEIVHNSKENLNRSKYIVHKD